MMKTIFLLVYLPVLLSMPAFVFSQSQQNLMYSIASWDIQLTCHKTSNLVFAQNIVSVDLGSAAILAQQASGVSNILQLKASQEDFEPTNLSVVTQDGVLHCFLVSYAADPVELNLSFLAPEQPRGIVRFSWEPDNQLELEDVAYSLRDSKGTKPLVKVRQDGMHFSLAGIYVYEDFLFFKLHFKNKSPIRYDIDQLRFFIRDTKQLKRTARQEKELDIEFVDDPREQIQAHTQQTRLLAIPKFTIPDGQSLIIQLIENNGGRHVELLLQHKDMLQAEIINSFKQ